MFNMANYKEAEYKASQEEPEEKSNHAEENIETSGSFVSEEAPDGGLRAWLVAAGAACTFFSTLGFSNSFGVFQEYYLAHQLQNESADNIAWIGSLSAFLQFATGAVGGPFFDRYGAWIIRPAAVLYVLALMMTSLCSRYWQFMLAQGALLGIVQGFLQFPALAAVSQYFDKKRAAALGVAISGSSIGGVVMPIALSKMLNGTSLGFGWSVRVIGFVIIPFLLFAGLAIRPRLPPRTTTFFLWSAFKDTKYVLLIVSTFFILLGMFTPLFFIPTYAVTRGVDATLASYLLAIVNAASTFGRIIPGILADKFGRLNMLLVGAMATGIIILCLTKANTTAGLVVYSVAFGFSSGTIISGAAAALTVCPKDPRDIGTYVGQGMAISAVAALIGPPVNGVLIDGAGGFLSVSIFSGVSCLIGACIVVISKIATPQGIAGKI